MTALPTLLVAILGDLDRAEAEKLRAVIRGALGSAAPPPASVRPAHGGYPDAAPRCVLGDVIKCAECGRQTRSISRGCSSCGHGQPSW